MAANRIQLPNALHNPPRPPSSLAVTNLQEYNHAELGCLDPKKGSSCFGTFPCFSFICWSDASSTYFSIFSFQQPPLFKL